MKKLVETFPEEFKDMILETVLKQIIDNPELKERFRKELKVRSEMQPNTNKPNGGY